MQIDVRQYYDEAMNRSHHGRPVFIQTVRSGGRGRPSYAIDRRFLEWAQGMGKTVSSIADYLSVSRQTIRTNLLRYGLAEPQANPFLRHEGDQGTQEMQAELADDVPLPTPPVGAPEANEMGYDDLLDPLSQIPEHLPDVLQGSQVAVADLGTQGRITSYTGLLSLISDEDLDNLVALLRTHFRRAGVTTLWGMLRNLGQRVQRRRISESLSRIDPVQRIFQRIRIHRRTYEVAGPNALWHHDGQHGMFVLHKKHKRALLTKFYRTYSLGDCNPWIH